MQHSLISGGHIRLGLSMIQNVLAHSDRVSSHLTWTVWWLIQSSSLIWYILLQIFGFFHDWFAKVFHAHEVFFLWILAKSHSYVVALFLISLQHYYKKMHPFCYHYYLQTSGTPSCVYKLLNKGVPNLTTGTTQCSNGMADNDEGLCSG